MVARKQRGITENHPKQPHTFKGQRRLEQEELVLQAHTTGKIKTSILRLPDFYGPGVERSLLTDLFVAAKQNRKAKLIGPIDKPHEFVFVPDVGPVVTKILDTPAAFGQAWNLAGVGTITQRELAKLAHEGRPRLMVANKMMLRLLGLFDPFLREFVEMHYLLTNPLIVDDSALQKVIGPIKKTSYAEGVRQTLIG
ncbi:MAG: NAD-dependent epimerase/dehydratase family protein [Limisphaerales bacterium]